mgnify:FL=1
MKTMIILLFAVLTSVSVAGQNLTLIVKDVEHVDGSVYVAIYFSKQTFMKKPVFGFRVGVKDRTIEIPCKGIPAGTYAISLFQDENENGKLDTGAFGRPLEKFGFSNDAEGVLGAPSFEKCFELERDTTMVIHLK